MDSDKSSSYLDHMSQAPLASGKILWQMPKRSSALAMDMMKKTVRWSTTIHQRHSETTSPSTSPSHHHHHHHSAPLVAIQSPVVSKPLQPETASMANVTEEVLLITVENDSHDGFSIYSDAEVWADDPHISSVELTRTPSQWEVRRAIWNEIRT